MKLEEPSAAGKPNREAYHRGDVPATKRLGFLDVFDLVQLVSTELPANLIHFLPEDFELGLGRSHDTYSYLLGFSQSAPVTGISNDHA